MDVNELLMTAGRAALVYVFLLVVVRLLGKRTVGNFTAFDLIVAFIMSEVVDEIIYGDVSLLQGLLPIALVAALHYLYSYLGFRSPTLEKLLAGQPAVLIRDGELDRRAMAVERISESEIASMLREKEIEELTDVKLGMLETNGQLSVTKTEQARELQSGDLQRLLERVGGPSTPPKQAKAR
jgi:uncharacterized membrane protein YcaP (DUF421 family)